MIIDQICQIESNQIVTLTSKTKSRIWRIVAPPIRFIKHKEMTFNVLFTLGSAPSAVHTLTG